MPVRPWMKWYPADWRADELLGMCSLAARGLWIEMIGIMHCADPYGHLVVNGRPPTDTQLAALARCSPDQIPSLLDELENVGVFSRTRTRVIYSRRMTRDERRSKDGRTAKITEANVPGSRRAQAIEKAAKKIAASKVVDKVVDEPPSPQKPESRIQIDKTHTSDSEPRATDSAGKVEGEFGEFWSAYPRKDARKAALKAYRAARKKADAPTLLAAVGGLVQKFANKDAQYIPYASAWLNGERWVEHAPQPAEVPALDPEERRRQTERDWFFRQAVEDFHHDAIWPKDVGPPPTDPDCRAPRWVLIRFGYGKAA